MKEEIIKLKRGTCYSFWVQGCSCSYFLRTYKGYYFIFKNVKFDVFKNSCSWQLNWQGYMLNWYETLKELKKDISENEKYIKLIEQIKQGNLKPHPKYLELISKQVVRK